MKIHTMPSNGVTRYQRAKRRSVLSCVACVGIGILWLCVVASIADLNNFSSARGAFLVQFFCRLCGFIVVSWLAASLCVVCEAWGRRK